MACSITNFVIIEQARSTIAGVLPAILGTVIRSKELLVKELPHHGGIQLEECTYATSVLGVPRLTWSKVQIP